MQCVETFGVVSHCKVVHKTEEIEGASSPSLSSVAYIRLGQHLTSISDSVVRESTVGGVGIRLWQVNVHGEGNDYAPLIIVGMTVYTECQALVIRVAVFSQCLVLSTVQVLLLKLLV